MGRNKNQSGWYAMRWFIFERDGFACQVCGQTAPSARLEVDHIIEVCEGGTDDPSNLRTLCFSCNRGRNAWLRMRVVVPEPKITAKKLGVPKGPRPGTKMEQVRAIVAERPEIKPNELAEMIGTSSSSARVMIRRAKGLQ